MAAGAIGGAPLPIEEVEPLSAILARFDSAGMSLGALSPEAHAPYITCPVLFLSATNDGHGLIDRAFEALAATTGPTSQVFTPRNDHHVAPAEGRDLPLWMDGHLKGGPAWPKTPELRLILDGEGIPVADVRPSVPG